MARKPKQVEDAILEAKKLEALVFGKAGEEPTPEPILEVGEPAPVAEVIPEPVVEETPPVIPTPIIEDGNSETWQSKFQVLKGKYDAEVPRLHDKVSMLEQMIANISAPKAPEPVVEKPPVATQKRVSKEMYDKFLEEYPVYHDIILDELDARLQDSDKVKKELEQIKKGQTQSAIDKLYDKLEDKVPDYNAINQNPEFAKWLNERDGYSSRTKYDTLLEAYNSADSKVVVDMFLDFKSTMTPAPAQVVKPDLTRQVVPSGTRGGVASSPTGASKEKIKQSTITKYYQDLALRKIHPKPGEKEAQEKAFHQAMLEGRVIYDQ